MSITILEVVLRETFLSKIRHAKKLQLDSVGFNGTREDEERRNLTWLTDSIDRMLARDRMEWARKLQRKTLTSGAIDADSVPGVTKGGKGQRTRHIERQRTRTAGAVPRVFELFDVQWNLPHVCQEREMFGGQLSLFSFVSGTSESRPWA